MARSKSGRHPKHARAEREQREAETRLRVEREREWRERQDALIAEHEREALAPLPELTEEEREDAEWAKLAAWTGDPNFRERYPAMIERLRQAIRLAAEELGLGVTETEHFTYADRGPVPNGLAYEAAGNVLPESWRMVMDPSPPGADVEWGELGEDDAYEELERQAGELWRKIEPQLPQPVA